MSGLANANGFSVARTSSYTELQVASLNVASGVNIGSGTLVRSGVVSKMITGYSPTSLIGSTVALKLNNVPGLPVDPATTVATALSTTLVVPAGVFITAVYMSSANILPAATSTYDVTTATGTTLSLFGTAMVENILTGVMVVVQPTGALIYGGAGVTSNIVNASFVTIQETAGTAATSGTIKVIIEYLVFPPG